MIVPRPIANRPRRHRYRPPPNTARRAPGLDNVACVAGDERRNWPRKNATKDVNSATTKDRMPKTKILATKTRERFGAAENVARIVPVL